MHKAASKSRNILERLTVSAIACSTACAATLCVSGKALAAPGAKNTDSAKLTKATKPVKPTKPVKSIKTGKPAKAAKSDKIAKDSSSESDDDDEIIKPNTKPVKSADGFDLYQTSTIRGDFDVFVSSQGIKIFDRKNITVTVAKPPTWDVYTYNNLTRRVCKQTFKAYKGMDKIANDTTGGANMLALPLDKGKPTDLHSIAAIECATSPEFQKAQIKDLEREAADPRFPKWAEFLYADKANIPAKAATILCRFYSVPDKGKIPLQFKYLNLRDELHTLLITSTLRPMKTLDNGFDPPKAGYKNVPDPSKLEDPVKAAPLRKTNETVRKIKSSP